MSTFLGRDQRSGEDARMTTEDAEEVADDAGPGCVESPREEDEGVRKMRSGDLNDAEEGESDGGVETGPEVDEDEREGGCEEGRGGERGEGLCGTSLDRKREARE